MKFFAKEESYISKKMRLFGTIETDADISIDGYVNGSLKAAKGVSLGLAAHFEGNIESETALVCGFFKGTIVAKRMIVIKNPAVIVGDLISDSVQVESGVAIQGTIRAKTIKQEAASDVRTIQSDDLSSEFEAESVLSEE